ncbi:tryptophan synthase beta subunit-like PLP-dependent enzyme [Lindgomyces ingoldianus]|uniref:Tryptophan synthase beta subunit-like PLP-dependent enzyme n=1 Tax=Lindgomyces ingoldianus TaxID=673940 RepID=A0ACB6RFV3_9PLEO|nr:tryptophan synthase beta subunit-like PLP-dependent enzyme [Lindgomyces ingoldianus]KAF2477930.1 tryptophan synthase beta subunit-like PLP-dependent enzyme [Lindgomyces ingoldianus]
MHINPSAKSWKYDDLAVDPAVENFHRHLPDYNETPLVSLPEVANELGLGHVLMKDESHRFGLPAFKILGASWAIYKAVAARCEMPLTCGLRELGSSARGNKLELVTCTEGNWGRATARMAKYLQIPATVFVPELMDQATQENISSEGAKVVVVEGDYDASIQAARKETETGNGLLVMDISWEGYEEIPQWVTEGYSTMLTETERQLQELVGKPVTHVFASVGVGSWAQAVSMHYKSHTPSSAVIAVEPESAACLLTSLEAGEITPIPTSHTIMNGMCCGTVSYTAWPILREGVDASVTVSDEEVHHDVQYLHSQGIQNGPCGAATLSALRKLSKEKILGLSKRSVVVLFSTEGARDYVFPH